MTTIARTALCLALWASSAAAGLFGSNRWISAPSKLAVMRGGADSKDATKRYPGLSKDEVLAKLNTIPVFGITDEEGNSVILKTDDGKQVNWLFLQKEAADSMQEFMQAQSPTLQLHVRDIPLGFIWERLSPPGNSTSAPAAKDEDDPVEVRLLADRTDVSAALNMTISNSQNVSSDLKVLYEEKAKILNSSWGVVPVFTMAQMKMRVNNGTQGIELHPWFLSVASCIESFKNAMERSGGDASSIDDASLHVSTLHELMEAMQSESIFDFRNIIFMPSKSSTLYLQEKVSNLARSEEAGGGSTVGGGMPKAPASSTEKSIFDDDDDDDDDIFKS